jgi:hypothetical protein
MQTFLQQVCLTSLILSCTVAGRGSVEIMLPDAEPAVAAADKVPALREPLLLRQDSQEQQRQQQQQQRDEALGQLSKLPSTARRVSSTGTLAVAAM